MAGCKFIPTLIFFIAVVKGDTYNVGTLSELQAALRAVNPGDSVALAPGTYYGFIKAERNGTTSDRITIEGPPGAILSSWSYGLQVLGSFYTLRGFTVSDAKKGIVVDNGSNNILENLQIHNIQEEGIHFRFFSSDNIVRNCRIYNTGTSRPGYGEGIYIGQDNGKWENGQPDRCDRNQILNNTVGPDVRAEGIDIKEGTCCGLIQGNYFDGHGLSNVNSDDSWIDVKGDSYVLENNRGYWTLKDGFQIRDHTPSGSSQPSGCNNVFRGNHCDLYSSGYCIFFANLGKCNNIVDDSNSLSNGGSMTNL